MTLRVAFVAASGGHWTQLHRLLPAFEGHRRFFVTYRNPQTDGAPDTYRFHELGRNPFRYAAAFIRALRILRKERPDVIVSTGAEIAMPFFFAATLLGVHRIYIETLTRIDSRSFTGKVLYRWTDEFYVQWPDTLQLYGPRAQYKGNVL